MTREEFISAWPDDPADPAGPADERFDDFIDWIQAEINGIDDLIPPLSIVRSAATAGPDLGRTGDSSFTIKSDVFTAAQPDRALDAGDRIIRVLFQLAMENYQKYLEEKKQYEKDARKERQKRLEKLLKDSKPKGKAAGAIYYEIYVKPLEELEKGSG
ncbi:MAG: hypothetical protein AAFX56_00880 [Pseudomonadota bacterium]